MRGRRCPKIALLVHGRGVTTYSWEVDECNECRAVGQGWDCVHVKDVDDAG